MNWRKRLSGLLAVCMILQMTVIAGPVAHASGPAGNARDVATVYWQSGVDVYWPIAIPEWGVGEDHSMDIRSGEYLDLTKDARVSGKDTWDFDIQTNSHALTLDSGGGNEWSVNGAIYGGGAVNIYGSNQNLSVRVVFSGSDANAYTGATTITRGSLELNKPAGVTAIPGDLVKEPCGDHTDPAVAAGHDDIVWDADEQIADTASVVINAAAARLLLGDHTETIRDLTLAGGAVISVNDGGRLNVTGTFMYNGSAVADGTYTSADWLTGGGTVVVGQGGEQPPVDITLSNLSATNGTLTLTLADVPDLAPVQSDFAATISIDGGADAPLSVTSYQYADKTVSFAFAAIAATGDAQSVSITLTHTASGQSKTASFTVPAADSGSQALVYEGFDYAEGTALAAMIGGRGLAGAWSVAPYGGTTASWTMVDGLSYPGIPSTGNALQVDITPGTGAIFSRGVVSGISANGEVWFSYLMKFDTNPVRATLITNDVVQSGFGRDDRPVFGAYGNVGKTTIQMGTTYLVVARFLNGNRLSMWVNPALDDEPSAVSAEFYDVTVSDGRSLGATLSKLTLNTRAEGPEPAGKVVFDELRAGASWEDITETVYAPKVPSAPADLAASQNEYSDKVELNWSVPSGRPDGYEVYRNTTNDSTTAARLGTVTTNSYTDTDVSPESAYFYWVKATNSLGASSFSSMATGKTGVLNAKTGLADLTAPVMAGISADGKTFSWGAVTNATGYQIYRNTSRSYRTAIKVDTVTATTYTDTASGRYYYWVRAIAADSQSLFSTAVSRPSATTKIVPIGDSITFIGTTWRSNLLSRLMNDGLNVAYVGNFTDSAGAHQGMNGAVIGPGESWSENPDFQNNVYDQVDSFMEKDPDLALMLIGINDFTNYQGDAAKQNITNAQYDGKALDRYEAAVRKMLDNKPEMTVVLCSLLKVSDGVAATHPAAQMAAFNAGVKALADKLTGENYSAYFIDMNSECAINPNDTSDLRDGLHPAEAGQMKMADVFYAHLSQLLQAEPAPERDIVLAPYPKSVTMGTGTMSLTDGANIIGTAALAPHGDALREEILLATGLSLTAASSGAPAAGDIVLAVDPSMAEEQYKLEITDKVTITGKDYYAVTYGTSTLLQLLERSATLPRLTILDQPDASYRAFSIDVARKYTSIAEIEKTIDLMRLAKLNYMQIHLTDDQNWMFPSDAFPLVGQAAKNTTRMPAYTKAELIGLVQYANARGIRMIPEIDMPGHSGLLTSVYPTEFGITGGGPINIASDAVRANVMTLIDEAIDIFGAAPYYHMGGDEVSFTSYASRPDFQAKFAALGVTNNDTDEIFRDFVNAVNTHVQSKGRTLIAWEGFGRPSASAKVKVSTDVILINWEHMYYGPQEMLDDGYTVVNGSWSPYYVCDHYPGNNYTMASPQEIYRYNRYMFGHCGVGAPGYNPPITVSDTLPVIGGMMAWWEGTEDHLVPLMRDRLEPFGAKLWNEAGETSYADFAQAAALCDGLFEKLQSPAAITAPLAQPLMGHYSGDSVTVTLGLHSGLTGGTLRYTVDGSNPTSSSTAYTAPFPFTAAKGVVKAAWFQGDAMVGKIARLDLAKVTVDDDPLNLALGKSVTVSGDRYPDHPASLITDGITGDPRAYWYGARNPQSVTIDLGAVETVGNVVVYSSWDQGLGDKFTIELSTDGASFTKAFDFSNNSAAATSSGYSCEFTPRDARYVRINVLGNSGGWADGDKARLVEVKVYGDEPGDKPVNVALHKPVSSNQTSWVNPDDAKKLQEATDGTLSGDNYSQLDAAGYIQIDLGESYTVDTVKMWHYALGTARTYHNVILMFSDDPTFATGVTVVFNSDAANKFGFGAGTDAEYAENPDGTVFTFAPLTVRYFRTYVNGFGPTSTFGHFQEVEIYTADETTTVTGSITSAVNGSVSLAFDGEFATAPVQKDFQVKLGIDGREANSVNVTGLTYDAEGNAATLSFIKVAPTGATQEVAVEVYFKGQLVDASTYTVAPAAALSARVSVIAPENASVDSTFEVGVALAENPGISEYILTLRFDEARIAPASDVTPVLTPAGSLVSNYQDPGRDKGTLTVSFTGNEDVKSDGLLFTVSFKALAEGTSDLKITCDSMTHSGETYDDFRVVTPDISGAAVKIADKKYEAGVGVGSVSDGRVNGSTKVAVSISDNPGITEFEYQLQFSESKMKPSAVTASGLIPSAAFIKTNLDDPKRPTGTLTVSLFGVSDFTANGILFTVSFNLLGAGTYPVTLVGNSMTRTGEGLDFAPVTANVVNGSITIINSDSGGSNTIPDPTIPKPVELPFKDISKNDWFYDAVQFVYGHGLFNGTSEEEFSPNLPVSRAMFITVLWRLDGAVAPDNLDKPFDDVVPGSYYQKAVAWGVQNGIVTGVGGGRFDPDQPITRESMATLLYRYMQYKGGGFTGIWQAPTRYSDWNAVSDWARESVAYMTLNGILNGKPGGVFDPGSAATRAEAAAIFQRYSAPVNPLA